MSRQSVGNCSVFRCGHRATIGGHILIVGSRDRDHYIVPLCHSCNGLEEEFEIRESVSLVHANVAETCGRKNSNIYSNHP